MTVREFKQILKKLPPSMEVVLFSGEDELAPACKQNSETIEAEVDGKKTRIFLIVPCSCGEEVDFNLN